MPSKQGGVPAASVNIYASDLTTLGAARFACLAEDCALPDSGTKAVRLEVRVVALLQFPWQGVAYIGILTQIADHCRPQSRIMLCSEGRTRHCRSRSMAGLIRAKKANRYRQTPLWMINMPLTLLGEKKCPQRVNEFSAQSHERHRSTGDGAGGLAVLHRGGDRCF